MTQLGAQMYTVREYTKTSQALRETLQKLAKIGYKAVQVSAIGKGIPAQDVANYLDETGLICAATHVGFDDLLGDIDTVIANHKLWNCEYVGVGSMPDRYRADAQGFVTFAKEASAVAEKLEANRLHLVYHNHNFEFRKFDGKLGMELLMENASPKVQFELDTFWVQKGGSDVIDWIKKVNGRMDVVHFKDMALNTETSEQQMAYIGEGNLNWDGIIAACRAQNVKWYLVEQDDCQGRDPFACLAASYAFLTGKGIA